MIDFFSFVRLIVFLYLLMGFVLVGGDDDDDDDDVCVAATTKRCRRCRCRRRTM